VRVLSEGVFVSGAFLLCFAFVAIEPKKSAGVKGCGSAKRNQVCTDTAYLPIFFRGEGGKIEMPKPNETTSERKKQQHNNSSHPWMSFDVS